jgi:hypothetical protein
MKAPRIRTAELESLGCANVRRFARAEHVSTHRHGRLVCRIGGPSAIHQTAQGAATAALLVATLSLVIHAGALVFALARAAW